MPLPTPVVIVLENGPGRHELRGTAPPGVNVEIEGDGLVVAVVAPRADGTWSVEVGDEPDGEVRVWYRDRATDEKGPAAHVFIESTPPPLGEVDVSPFERFAADGPVMPPLTPPGAPHLPSIEFPRDTSAEVRGEPTGQDALRFDDAPNAPAAPPASGITVTVDGNTPPAAGPGMTAAGSISGAVHEGDRGALGGGPTSGNPDDRGIDVDTTPLSEAEFRRHERLLRGLGAQATAPPDGGGLTDADRRRIAEEVMEPSERAALDPPFARPGHLEIDPEAEPAPGESGGKKPDLILSYTLPEDIRATDLAPRGPDDVPLYGGGARPPSVGSETQPAAVRRLRDVTGGQRRYAMRVILMLIAVGLVTLGVCTYDFGRQEFVLNPPPPVPTVTQTSEALPTTVARNPADIGGAVPPPPVASPAATSAAVASTVVASPTTAAAANRPPEVRLLQSTLATPVTRWVVSAEDPDGDAVRYSWFVAANEKCGTPRLDIGPVDGPEVRWSHSSAAPDSCAHPSPNHEDVVVTLVIRTDAHRIECVMRGTETVRWDPSQVCALQRG